MSCSSDICDMRVMYLCRYTLSLILCHLLRLDQELKWDSEDFVFPVLTSVVISLWMIIILKIVKIQVGEYKFTCEPNIFLVQFNNNYYSLFIYWNSKMSIITLTIYVSFIIYMICFGFIEFYLLAIKATYMMWRSYLDNILINIESFLWEGTQWSCTL